MSHLLSDRLSRPSAVEPGIKWAFLAALALAAVLGVASPLAARQAQPKTTYISVVDSHGLPVPELRMADVTVTEDGRTRQVLRVERATEPMKIAVVLDEWGLGRGEVRQSLNFFISAMRDKADIGLFSASRPDRTLSDFTRDGHALTRAIQNLVTMRGAYSYDLDTLTYDLARQFLAQETPRPIIVALVGAGDGDTNPARIVEEVLRSRTTLFAIAGRDHARVVDVGAEASGGRVEMLIIPAGIPAAMRQMTDEILGQYALTYSAPTEPKDGSRLRVEVSRPGVTVRAPARVY